MCAGSFARLGSSGELESAVGYCETFGFAYSLGAFAGIDMGVVSLMWLYVGCVFVSVVCSVFDVGGVDR